MKPHPFAHTALAAAFVVAGCSTLPAKNTRLEEARSEYHAAQNNPHVAAYAGSELKQAGDALNQADTAWTQKEAAAKVDQLAYLARQRIAIAQETASLKAAEAATAHAAADLNDVRLAARTQEADAAIRNANVQRWRAEHAEARSDQLEAQLKALHAKQTDRGLMIPLGEVLFDPNQAKIKSGGMRHVQKLAEVLSQYPDRHVLIEGFTDNTGSDSHNQALSERRANAVRTSLLDMGISDDRVTSRGYGKNFPVAGNITAVGRQLNRRVEVTISNDGEQIAPRVR